MIKQSGQYYIKEHVMSKRIWFCGVPGSRWSGVDIQIRKVLPCDTTDESPERTFFHRLNTPGDSNNGHRGAYWGPGMGCGEDWMDLQKFTPEKLETDINDVFHGEGYRVIKSHFFARFFNLDYIYNNFPGDYMFLIYREPQKSFAWWSEVMDFSDGHYPDYRPGYTDYNTMHKKLWEENMNIVDFVLRKKAQFEVYNPQTTLAKFPGFDKDIADTLKVKLLPGQSEVDIFASVIEIPK